MPEELRDHPDRLRWNARYRSEGPIFAPHPLVAAAFAAGLPAGPVLELACGRSGSALELAAAGRAVIAVDVSDLALAQLEEEAERRGLGERVDCVSADVPSYDPGGERFALVLASLYWDPDAFRSACRAVLPGGLLGWEALALPEGAAGEHRPWHVAHGELGTRLPPGFDVLAEEAVSSGRRRSTRVLARRAPIARG
ncbi:class I SAM-dependent methyltransferase [Allosalinactinospora lopnorensis]|uniref:class I SAM-dependent methyltransferase n=1 Tax=Allosalinactinospora lopnorensis TaxID=1352348 RepID=UPI000A41080A|nr:class I SAM-dependent methyltransferase [Allosalinactinospora lopnorensis]